MRTNHKLILALLIVLLSPTSAYASYGSELDLLLFFYFVAVPIGVISLVVAVIYFYRRESKLEKPEHAANAGVTAEPNDYAQLEGFEYYTRKEENGTIGGNYSCDQLRKR